MNYKKIYESLISNSISRDDITDTCYTERHHIIPTCIGGSNNKDNITILTAREHFMAHWLLYKIHKSQLLSFAWQSMCGNHNGKRYNSHSFKYAREAWAKNISDLNRGKKFSEESKLKMSNSAKGRAPWNKGLVMKKKETEMQEAYRKDPKKCLACSNFISFRMRNRNKYCSMECRNKKCSDWMVTGNHTANSGSFKLGNKISKSTASKISAALTGLKRPTGECQHCGKVGAISLLKRWHYNNCKWRVQ